MGFDILGYTVDESGVHKSDDNKSNPLETVFDLATQYSTFGLVGSKDGKGTKGVVTNLLDEGIGEVSGRNAARKQMMENKDLLNEAAIAKAQQLKDEQARKGRLDIEASQQAGFLRDQAAAQQRNLLGTSSGSDMAKDFLGI